MSLHLLRLVPARGALPWARHGWPARAPAARFPGPVRHPCRCARLDKAKKLLQHINKTFGTLAFCRRWLERDDGGSFAVNGLKGKQERYIGGLKALCDADIVVVCASRPALRCALCRCPRRNPVPSAHALCYRSHE